MFTKDEDAEAPASAAPDAAPPAEAADEGVSPAEAPAAESGPSAAPSSRGWTMFMEPDAKGGAQDGPAAPAVDAAPEAGKPAAPAVEGAKPAEGAAPKKRGWTMFMNAPLEDLPQKEGEDKGAEAPAAPVSNVEAADQKGWTVFGAPALKRPDGDAAPAASSESGSVETSAETPEPAAPSRGKTIMVTNPSPTPPVDTPSGSEPAADAALASAPTVVNTGAPAGTPVQKGKTIVATSAPNQPKPDTMYFKKGEVEPEGGISPRAPTVRDVPSPSPRPVEERVARTGSQPAVPAVPEPADLEPAKSSNTALYAIAGAVVVVAAVAAYFAFS